MRKRSCAHTLQLFVHTRLFFFQPHSIPFWSFNCCSGSNHWWWLLFIHIYSMCASIKKNEQIQHFTLSFCCCDCFLVSLVIFAVILFFHVGYQSVENVFVKRERTKKYQNWLLSHYLYPIAHCTCLKYKGPNTADKKKSILNVNEWRWDKTYEHIHKIYKMSLAHTRKYRVR